MRWNRFFEDLEHQLDSAQAAEQLAIDGEAERLRVSRLELRSRLAALIGAEVTAELAADAGREHSLLRGVVTAVGTDWVGLVAGSTEPFSRRGAALVPTRSLRAVHLDRAALALSRGTRAGSAPSAPAHGARLGDRQTFAYVLRDFARRRLAVTVHHGGEHTVHGTIDRVGADHLELALHERGSVRREAEVSGVHLVPLHAVAWVRVDRPDALAL